MDAHTRIVIFVIVMRTFGRPAIFEPQPTATRGCKLLSHVAKKDDLPHFKPNFPLISKSKRANQWPALVRITVLTGIFLLILNRANAVNYYSWTNGAPEATASWWTGTNGTGTHPANFTNAADLFVIQNNNTMTLAANWTVAGAITVSSGCTLSATVAAVTVGSLTIDLGGTLTTAQILTVSGATNITGTINFITTIRANVFTGAVTLNSGANWNEAVAITATFSNNFTNNATTFAASTGLHTFNGATRTLSGSTIVNIPSLTFTGNYTNSATLTCSTALTVTGAAVVLTNNGTITASTALSGTGRLTNGATGILNLSGAGAGSCAITTLSNAGTINRSGAGTTTTVLANFTNTGTVNISGSGTIAGITNNAAGIVNHSGSSTITSFNNATATSTLNISTTPTVPTFGTLTVTAAGNTVNYTGLGPQTVKDVAYQNLTISGSGTKTWTFGANRTMGGILTVSTGTELATAGNRTFTVTGASSISGTLTLGNTRARTFTGNVAIIAGGVWNDIANQNNAFAGNLQFDGTTFTSGTGVYTFSGATKTISGSTPLAISSATFTGNYTNTAVLTCATALSVTGAAITLTNNSTINATTVLSGTGRLTNGASGILNLSGAGAGSCAITTLTNSGTINRSGAGTTTTALASFTNTGTVNISGSGTIAGITNNAAGIVNHSGSSTITSFSNANATSTLNISTTPTVPTFGTLTATVAGNTVNYTGGGPQAVKDVSYSNLTISGSGTKTWTLTANRTVGGILTVSSGTELSTTGNFTLGVTGAANITGTLTLGGTAAKTFTGDVTLNTSAIWTESAVAAYTFAGNFTNNASTFTASTGTHTFSGATKVLSGNTAIVLPTTIFTGNYTNNAVLTCATALTVTGAAIVLTNNGTITASTALSGTGRLTNGATGILNLSGAGVGSCAITTLSNAGTINRSGAGTTTTVLANFTNTGTVNISGSGTIAGITNNAAGIVNHSGSSTITSFNNATATSTLNISTSPTVPTFGTLTTTFAGNTVNYTGLGPQSIIDVAYSNLTISGSGTKTWTLAANRTVGGVLTVLGGTGLTTTGNFTFGVTGATNLTGNLILDGTAAKTFTGDVTLNNGAVWTEMAVAAYTFSGNVINNATTFTASSGTHTFNGVSKTLSGSTIISIPTATFTGNCTISATLSCSTALTVTGVTLTNSGTINASALLTGTGGLTQGASGTLNLGGTIGITTLTATAVGNRVDYNGSAQSCKVVTYHHLTLSGSGVKTFPAAITINGDLAFSGSASANLGTFSSTANALTFNGIAQSTGTWGSSTSSATNQNNTYFSATTGIVTINSSSCITGTWLGTTDTNWHTASNWCSGIPTSTTDVTINSGTPFQPNIGSAAVCRDLAISMGSSLTITGSNSLTVSGNWENDGTFTQSGSTLIFDGSTTIGGLSTTSFGNVVINSGKTLTAAAAMNISGDFTNDGTFAHNNGSITFSGSTTIAGSATTTFNSIVIGSTLTGKLNGNIILQGDWANNGTYNRNGGTITFDGNSTVSGSSVTTFGNVVINAIGSLTAPSSMNIASNFTNDGSFGHNNGTVNFTGTTTISGSSTTTFNHLTISSILTSKLNSKLTVQGDWTNNGTFNHNGGTIVFDGTIQSIGGSASTPFNNLEISAGSNTSISSSSPTVKGILLSDGTLNVNSNLTLISDVNQTALIDGSGTGSVLGNVTMQRYLSSAYGYKYFSSPFSDATVGQFSSYLSTTATIEKFFAYDENHQNAGRDIAGWTPYLAGTLNPMAGYAANLGLSATATPITVNISGTVNDGNISNTLYNNNRTYTQGFNLAGNPYPSPIDWDLVDLSGSNIDGAIYFFTATPGTDEYAGVYSSYVNGAGGASRLIPSMQGFFVHVTGSFGNLSLTNSVRTIDLSAPTFKATTLDPRTILRFSAFTDEKMSINDTYLLYIDQNATLNFDKEKDALKLMNTDVGVPNIYSITPDSKQLSINGISEPVDSITTISMGIKMWKDGWVNLHANEIPIQQDGLKIYLLDKEKNIIQDLSLNPAYRIYLKTGEYQKRFLLLLAKTEVLILPIFENKLFSLSRTGGDVIASIYLPDQESGSLTVSDILGRKLMEQTVSNLQQIVIGTGVKSGIYVVTLRNGKQVQSEKIIIQKEK